jgi:signal transduction histidine kinase
MTTPPRWAGRFGSRTLPIATAAMAVLLVILAILQYYWVGQVAQVARERLRRDLETAADRIADDFNREIFRAFAAFQPSRDADQPLAERLADGWDAFRASALEPALVAAVYLIDPFGGDTGGGGQHAVLYKLNADDRKLERSTWPPELIGIEDRAPLNPRVPALLLPARPLERALPERDLPSHFDGIVVVLIDRAVIADVLLPSLVDVHIGSTPRDTDAWVLDRTRRGETLFATAPLPRRPPELDPGVAVRPLLVLRPFPELRAQGFRHFFDDPEARRQLERFRGPAAGPRAPMRGAPRRFGARSSARPEGVEPGTGRPGGPGPWTLILARSEGSLDAAVARLRWRNLGVGLSVVVLLGATSGLLLLSARHVQRLSRREMELVAGITHELRTPLAAIGSAADNLADGVVEDHAQVRRYGSLIRGETHRLGALVAQVLDFAGSAASGRRARPLEAVDVAAIVDHVLGDLAFPIEEKGFTVERRCDPGTPLAFTDPEALRRALDNVVGNALKYGEAGRWLGIEVGHADAALGGAAGSRARDRAGAPRVAVRVRDRGPGIARAERRRVFEPFYRGQDAAARHLHGTGLGLAVTRSLLEEIGGTIEIEESEPGRGTTFLITLPAATGATAGETQGEART